MIQLVGPGGAGKTTVGLALATRLGLALVDLNEQFTVRAWSSRQEGADARTAVF
jgi:shikimate kinase